MKIFAYVLSGTALVGIALACGGGAAYTAKNTEACERFSEHVQSLDCMGNMKATYSGNFCDTYKSNGFVDYSGFFDCMTENMKCAGDLPDTEALGNLSIDNALC